MYDMKLEELLDLDSVGFYSMDDDDLLCAQKLLFNIVERDWEASEELLDEVDDTLDIINVELASRGLI